MTAAAPLPGSRASVLAEHATPGRMASFALHLAFLATLLVLPRPHAPPEPPVVRLDIVPPPDVAPPPPPPPEPRAKARPRPPVPAQARPPAPAPTPPAPEEAEPLPRPTTAPRAEPLAAARAAAAPIADAAQDAPFLAAQAERAEALRPATTAAPSLSSVAADTPWIGGAAERTEQIAPATPNVAARDLASAKAAPDQLQFAPEPSTTPDDARKRAEDEARKRAGLTEPKADRGDAPLATGGQMAGGPASGGSSGGPASSGGGAPPAGGGGVRAAIRGISIDGLNEKVGCDNPDDARLSEDERAACNRRRWAGARGAAELGAVKARDQRVFDAAAARKTPPTAQKGVGACRATGAAGAGDCLPDTATAKPQR